MITRDYHNYTVERALRDVDEVVTEVRMNRPTKYSTEDAEFIVGHGKIRDAIVKFLKEEYGLSPTVQLGNSGVIICTIE